jgi:uncharacterized protein (DUF697 family)
MQQTSGAENVSSSKVVSPVDEIIYRHVAWVTLGTGFPVPLLDVAVVLGFQLRMVKQLCEHYGVPFREQRVRSIVIGLLSGVATEGVAKGPFVHFVTQSIPAVNWVAAFLKAYIPFKLGIVVAGGATFAMGRIFAQHLSAGGTLDEESASFTEYFNDQLKLGIEHVRKHNPLRSRSTSAG